MKPEYADLELYQVAHMELKERLFSEVRVIGESFVPSIARKQAAQFLKLKTNSVSGAKVHNAPFAYSELNYHNSFNNPPVVV